MPGSPGSPFGPGRPWRWRMRKDKLALVFGVVFFRWTCDCDWFCVFTRTSAGKKKNPKRALWSFFTSRGVWCVLTLVINPTHWQNVNYISYSSTFTQTSLISTCEKTVIVWKRTSTQRISLECGWTYWFSRQRESVRALWTWWSHRTWKSLLTTWTHRTLKH